MSVPAGAWELYICQNNHRVVQWFLVFANFYSQFIQKFSQVALPLTDPTSTWKCFCWLSQGQDAFTSLKSHFVLAHILPTLDPSVHCGGECVRGSRGSFVPEITFGWQNTSLHALRTCCLCPGCADHEPIALTCCLFLFTYLFSAMSAHCQ